MSPEFEKLMKDLKEEGREEGAIEMLFKLIKQGALSISDAAKSINMSENEFKSLMPA